MKTLTYCNPFVEFTGSNVLLRSINVVGFFAWFACATKATHVFFFFRFLSVQGLKQTKPRTESLNMKKEYHEVCMKKKEKEKEDVNVVLWSFPG